jgi:hypothetical protein
MDEPKRVRALGVDLGSGRTGWGVHTPGRPPISGCIEWKNAYQYLSAIRTVLQRVRGDIDVVVVEEPHLKWIPGKGRGKEKKMIPLVSAFRKLSKLADFWEAMAADLGLDYLGIQPAEWRKGSTKKTGAKRAEAKAASVAQGVELFGPGLEEDEYEALFISDWAGRETEFGS